MGHQQNVFFRSADSTTIFLFELFCLGFYAMVMMIKDAKPIFNLFTKKRKKKKSIFNLSILIFSILPNGNIISVSLFGLLYGSHFRFESDVQNIQGKLFKCSGSILHAHWLKGLSHSAEVFRIAQFAKDLCERCLQMRSE